MGDAYSKYAEASADQNQAWLAAWALPGFGRFRAMEESHREALVADAMEAVLEDTLRLNKVLVGSGNGAVVGQEVVGSEVAGSESDR